MKHYDTLTSAINDLQKRGFDKNFNVQEGCVFCAENETKLTPSDFDIVEFHRFEGMTDPADSSVLYAIESKDKKIKGVLVDAYGAYSNSLIADNLQKMAIKIPKEKNAETTHL